MDWVPSKSLEQGIAESTEQESHELILTSSTSAQEKGEAGQDKMLDIVRGVLGQLTFGLIWEESHEALGAATYAERKRKNTLYCKCRREIGW